MSCAVCLAARIPARRAVPSTSPLGALPLATAAAVALDYTQARERLARPWVTCLSPTSTIRAAPA